MKFRLQLPEKHVLLHIGVQLLQKPLLHLEFMFPLSQSPSAVLKSISDPPNFAAALQMRRQLCVRGDVTNRNMVTWPRNPDNLPEIYM